MNPYIPWDVSYLERFLAHVRGSIGSSVNIGILIFAAITGVMIIHTVVRKFIR